MSSNRYTKRETHVFKPKVCISLGPGLPPVPILDCLKFPSAQQRYQFTITTISPPGLGGCASYNNTWQLDHGTGCLWQTSAFDPIVGAPTRAFTLQYDSALDSLVLSAGSTFATYQLPATAWTPTAPTTLQLNSVTGTCQGWPQTVTIYPA